MILAQIPKQMEMETVVTADAVVVVGADVGAVVVEDVVQTSSPDASANTIAIVATPPPIPVMRTFSPLCARPRVNKALNAVTPQTGKAAASFQLRWPGLS